MDAPPPPPPPPPPLSAEAVAVPLAIAYGPQALALGVVLGVVIPRVWLPLLDRDGGADEAFLWLVALPLAALAASLPVPAALWRLRQGAALRGAFAAAEAATARALDEGGDATLVGVARGEPTPAPGSDVPCLGWVRREPVDLPTPFGPRTRALSAAGPFELVCDDGSVVAVRAGPWRVADPFGPWVDAGEWALVAGDRVRVKGRVEVSLEPAAAGDYRASARRREIAPEGGLIAPVGAPRRAPEASRRRFPMPWEALAVVALHAVARVMQPAPVHADVALGLPCDGRHLCASGSFCEARGAERRATCRRDCARDGDCGEGLRCDEDGHCMTGDPFRPGTRTQGEDCAHAACAPGHRCVRNIESIGRDGGMGEVYCAKECRRDDECPAGTWCTVMSNAGTVAWCSRLEDLPPVIRVMMRIHRDGALPEPPDAAE